MKKITLIISLFTVCTFVHAQMNTTVTKISKLKEKGYLVDKSARSFGPSTLNKSGLQSPTQKAAFYSEDFESVTAPAVPAGYTITTNATDGGYVTGDYIDANVGTYWPVPDHTQFIMANDDVCNCDKSADYLELPTFDFTGEADMSLRFAGYDDGAFGQVPSTVELNINSAGWNVIYTFTPIASWQNITIPLTGTDNMASVQIRFHYDDGGQWATGLAIDDIVIDLPLTSDLELVTDSGMTYLDPWLTPVYSKIPVSQVGVTTFEARITNKGTSDQSNVFLNVDVSDGSNTVFSAMSPSVGTMNPGANSVFTLGSTFSPSNLGTYTMTFTAGSDSIDGLPINNVAIKSYEVTDTVFARDDEAPVYSLTAAAFGAAGPYEFANWFETAAAEMATSISFVLGPNTVVGSVIQGKIYTPDGVTVLESTAFYTILSSDVGVFPNFPTITLMLDNPYQLGDTSNYLVSVADFSGNDSALAIISTDVISDAEAVPGYLFADGSWGGIAYYPFIRLNIEAPAVICNISATGTAANCGGFNGGSASVTATGGTAPYSYLWDDASNATTDAVSGLTEGVTYTVGITDASGCTYQVSLLIPASSLVVTASSVDADCGAADGSATATPTGGVAPYMYLWNDPSAQTNANATGLLMGSYTCSVTDAAGCMGSITEVVGGVTALQITTALSDPSGCGATDGYAVAAPTNGVAPFTYLWSDSTAQTTDTASALAGGVYNVTVTDSAACSITGTIALSDVGAPSTTGSSTIVTCFGDSDGTATATATGGSGPLTYLWSDMGAQDSSTATGLMTGMYSATVEDSLGCQAFVVVTISGPTEVAFDDFTSTDITCNGDGDGSITSMVSGGTGSLTYVWDATDSTQNLSNLSAGSHTLVVSDSLGCSVTDSATITDPAALTLSIASTDVDCKGGTNGTIASTAGGGTGSKTYTWTPAGTSAGANATNLSAGTYTVMVTDDNNCVSSTETAVITEPAAIDVTITSTDETVADANDGTITAQTPTGGTPNYSTSWSSPNGFSSTDLVLTDLEDDTYTLTVTDGNGCVETFVETIAAGVSTAIAETINDVEFRIYPNPNTGQFIVELNNLNSNGAYQIEIRNIIGQVTFKENVSALNGNFYKQIDLTSSETGVYFISLINDEGKTTKKLIVY